MKKGAVPIPHIVALLLGIVVIALVGYWFFVQSGLWGQQSSLTICQGNAQAYCNTWKSQSTYYKADGVTPSIGWFDDLQNYPGCKSSEAQIFGTSHANGNEAAAASAYATYCGSQSSSGATGNTIPQP
jgi:hypothetical protein